MKETEVHLCPIRMKTVVFEDGQCRNKTEECAECPFAEEEAERRKE